MANTAPSPHLRTYAASLAIAGTLFWLYTFYAIAHVPPGDGTGMQWLAVVPLGMVFLFLTLPALLLAAAGRLLGLAFVMGFFGVIAFAIVWMQLLNEFPKR